MCLRHPAYAARLPSHRPVGAGPVPAQAPRIGPPFLCRGCAPATPRPLSRHRVYSGTNSVYPPHAVSRPRPAPTPACVYSSPALCLANSVYPPHAVSRPRLPPQRSCRGRPCACPGTPHTLLAFPLTAPVGAGLVPALCPPNQRTPRQRPGLTSALRLSKSCRQFQPTPAYSPARLFPPQNRGCTRLDGPNVIQDLLEIRLFSDLSPKKLVQVKC